jgi:hypothetical protein
MNVMSLSTQAEAKCIRLHSNICPGPGRGGLSLAHAQLFQKPSELNLSIIIFRRYFIVS